MKITETALKLSAAVLVLALFIAVVGIMSYRALPLESMPEVEIPIMLVSTVYPGVSPEDMEKLVTNVMEREVKELKDIKKLTSSSAESVSVVNVEFEVGVDLDVAYQKLKAKVDQAKAKLPADVEDPTIIEISTSDFPIMLINVSADYDQVQLKNVAEKLEERIEQVPGVLDVDLTGGVEREIQIYLDPQRLEYYSMGVGQVISRIQQEHMTTPAGNLDLGGSRYAVRIPGEYRDVKLMEDIVLKAPEGNPVRLRDVGHVVDGLKERESMARINGTECVTLRIKKRTGESIVRIADDIRALLEKEAPTLPAGTSFTIRQDESKFVRDQVADLENNIITGLILVIGVLLFVMGVRNAIFVAIAIPLSMLMTFIILRIAGITLNTMVLFSLVLALGMLVDNSIVVVENIYRHMAEGASRATAALEATNEVAWPVITSTLTTVVAFAPLLMWPGIMGDFMKYLPITVIASLSSSLFVALVINPVIGSKFMSAKAGQILDESGEVKTAGRRAYGRVLGWSIDHPVSTLAIAIAMFAGIAVVFTMFNAGVEFFPSTTPERAQVTISAPQGTLLSRTNDIVGEVEDFAAQEDNVETVVASVGFTSSWVATGGSNTNKGLLDLEFKDRKKRSHSTWDTIESMRRAVAGIAGAEIIVDAEKMGPPTGAPVSVEVSGPDFSVLAEQAAKVEDLLATVSGVVDIKNDYEASRPEIRIEVDREQAMTRKVSSASISQAVRTAINGTKAAVLREGDNEYDMTVRYEGDYRKSIEDILSIRVTGKDDVQVPLRDVAKVETTGGLGAVSHIGQRRTIQVTADVSGRSSSEIMPEVIARLETDVPLPKGYFFTFTGENEEQKDAQAFLSEALFIGLMLIAMILIAQFNSVQRPSLILTSVVMSFAGVMIGLLVTQTKFGVIMTGLGVISLAGVVVNNAIVLIDYADQLRTKLGLPLREALMRAGQVRLRPVLLTAITTVLGMLPMAAGVSVDFRRMTIDTSSPMLEWWGPMARAVAFGLIFATALTLLLVPSMYMLQERTDVLLGRLFRRAPQAPKEVTE